MAKILFRGAAGGHTDPVCSEGRQINVCAGAAGLPEYDVYHTTVRAWLVAFGVAENQVANTVPVKVPAHIQEL